MKCQHCGKNEATFYYKSTVNGRTTEARLCEHCAEALGYADSLRPMAMLGEGFFAHPFSVMEPFFGGLASRLLTEFPAPGNTLEEARQTAQPKAEPQLIPEEERRAFDLQRRRNALQERLKAAIAEENYEEAARVRDELRALPAQ